MMYLLRSWKDSLSLFLPSNFKLFFLVTVKDSIQVYKDLFKYFWWLILATSVVDYWFARYGTFLPNQTVVALTLFALLFLWFLYYFAIYLTIRPSMKPKGYEYYCEYGIYFIYFMVFSFIAYAHRYAYMAFWYPFAIIDFVIYLSPLLTFCILFLLDSDGSFKSAAQSVWRGIKMWFYNLPFCIIVFALFSSVAYLLFLMVFALFGIKSFLFSPIVSALLLPIPLTFLNNFYVKRLHDQFTLYFPESIKEQ